MTTNALYEGVVRHRRMDTPAREFTKSLFLAHLDLDSLPSALDGLPLWSARRPAPVHYRHRDFFDSRDEPVAPRVRDLVEARLGRRPAGPIFLLAHLRTFGWLFNPLAVYYCWQADGRALDAIVLEVSNTPWHERCWYVFDAQAEPGRARAPKAMHVSPFLPMELDYDVSWTTPADELQLRIEVRRGAQTAFDAELALHRLELTPKTATSVLARHPIQPTRVSAGIYGHAARLALARARTYRHPSRRPRKERTMQPARTAIQLALTRLTGGTLQVTDRNGTRRFGKNGRSQDLPAIHAHVTVHDPRVYARVLRDRSVGLGTSYADGWWDADDLTGVLRLVRRSIEPALRRADGLYTRLNPILDRTRPRRPDPARDARNVRAHYDLGNELFERILDDTMSYSCAEFANRDEPLTWASMRKMGRLAQLLDLHPGDRILEIGSGWGAFAEYAATDFGCHVTTTTISRRQYEYVRERIARAGLGDRVDVQCVDYRSLTGTYDKVIAIEMIEAVDWREYDAFFAQCRRLVHDAGAVALQAIVVSDASFDRAKHGHDFIKSVIFPGSCIPSAGALERAARHSGLTLTHRRDIGPHYAETLRRWRANLAAARPQLADLGFDERSARLWEFYFSYCEAGFEDRSIGDVQLLFTAPAWRPAALAPRPSELEPAR